MKLNFFTSLSNTGYGIAGYNIVKALINEGADPALFLVGNASNSLAYDAQDMLDRVLRSIKEFDKDAPFLKLWHQFDLLTRIGNGRYFGWPIFELNRFNPTELDHLNIPDELIVCSTWAKQVLQNNQINKKIHVVPLGVDSNTFFPDAKLENGPYIFYNIGKLEKRKGHDFLPHVFSKAFNKNDDVELHLMCNNPFLSEEENTRYIQECKSTKLGDKIQFFRPVPSSRDVAHFINQRDCGVFPARAEGWNMELLESMSCGKPVITTNYSAHTEYCNGNNSFLIEPTELESAYDGKWFFNQGEWMTFDFDEEEQLIEYLRHCYMDRPSNQTGLETAKEFSWIKTAKKLINVISL